MPDGFSFNHNTGIHFVTTRPTCRIGKNLFHFHNDLLLAYFAVLRQTRQLEPDALNMYVFLNHSSLARGICKRVLVILGPWGFHWSVSS